MDLILGGIKMILEKIKEIIAEQLNLDEETISEDTSFEDLGLDSLDLFQVVIEIEEEFDIQIEDAESIKTVRDAVRSEEHTSELQSRQYLVCRLLLEKKKTYHTLI